MVDPARFFIPTADLKKFVDMMAYADFQTGILDNHHLSDEQIEQSLEKIAALQPEKELIV